jgi:hypothetical protein
VERGTANDSGWWYPVKIPFSLPSRLRKKVGRGMKPDPQRLKPYLFTAICVRAEARCGEEARTLQNQGFSAAC